MKIGAKIAYGTIAAILLLGLGGLAGWFIRISYQNSLPVRLVEVRKNSPEYKYINPLLLVDAPRQSPEFDPLKSAINRYISSIEAAGGAQSVSVYYRNVNSGRWMGINENTVYDPSSMLKVAVMIGYLNEAQSNPSIMNKQLPYTAHIDPGQNFKPAVVLSNGPHSVRELIDVMIRYSDNDALESLYNYNRDAFVEVLKELEIPPPATAETTDFVSAKQYSTIFRTLYSSTYLDAAFSEQALKLMTQTDFTQGIVAGVPTSTTVAHKFGEHTTTVNNLSVQSRQLHDCGIVYYPSNPYFLCVMTRGYSFDQLQPILSTISKMTYDFVAAGDTSVSH